MMSKKHVAARDLYQEVTDRIIEALEQGVTPWVCPWEQMGPPRNASTGRRYSGINALILGLVGLMKGYTSQEWLTFKQAKAAGGLVRKGSKGTTIVFYKTIERERDDESAEEGDEQRRVIPIMRSFTVFNLDQIDGIERPERPLPEGLGNEAAKAIVAGSGAAIMHGRDRAYYAPKLDLIRMPDKWRFEDGGAYYATLLHELVHWTGHESRLARVGITGNYRFGTPEYAFEELVAELGAAFLCAEIGIKGELRHEGYIASWLEVLKGDKKAIFRAASAAQKAADLLAAPIRADASDGAA